MTTGIENNLGCQFIRINPAKKKIIFLLKLVRYLITQNNQLKKLV